DLYQTSCHNGCNMSWEQWSGGPVLQSGSLTTKIGTIGSILAVNPAIDFGLSADEAIGLVGNYQFQVTVSVKNTNQTNSIDASLYIVTVENGVMNIVHGGANTNIGVITPMDILNSKTENATYASYGDIIDINGGNFFDSLK